MNTSSFIGQLSSTVLVRYFRAPAVMIIATFCCSVILFGMIGVHTVTGVVVFGVLYGYFAGICTSFAFSTMTEVLDSPCIALVLALWTPVLALLTPDLSELG